MSGRQFSTGSGYRYGFNGKEKDSDIAADNYDFGARIYDARIGRWMAADSKADRYESSSPYNFCMNSPLKFIDPNGKEIINPYKMLLESALKTMNEEEAKFKTAQSAYEDALRAIKPKSELSKAERRAQKANLKELETSKKSAETAYNHASSEYKNAKANHDLVENYLDDYFYYDPEGYLGLNNLTICENDKETTIDIYIEIDDALSPARAVYVNSMVGSTNTSVNARHVFGETEYAIGGVGEKEDEDSYALPMAIGVPGFDENVSIPRAIKIRVNKDDDFSTIPHEKGHAVYFANNCTKLWKEEMSGEDAHSDGNPDGKTADMAQTQYENKKNNSSNPRPADYHRPPSSNGK